MATNRVDEHFQQWQKTQGNPSFFRDDYENRALEFLERVYKAFGNGSAAEQRTLQQARGQFKSIGKIVRPSWGMRFMRLIDPWHHLETWAARMEGRPSVNRYKMKDFAQWMPPGLSWTDKVANLDLVNQLSLSLRRQGLPHDINRQTAVALFQRMDDVKMTFRTNTNGKLGRTDVYLERGEMGRYYPMSYDLGYYRGLELEKPLVAGINVADLQSRMEQIDWRTLDLTSSRGQMSSNRVQGELAGNIISGILRDLHQLLETKDPEARRAHDQLVVKYFGETPNEALVPDLGEIKKQFERKVHVDLSLAEEYRLQPWEAHHLISSGPINRAEETQGRGAPWIGVEGNGRDNNGFLLIKPIEGSQDFNLPFALAGAKVVDFPDMPSHEEGVKALLGGQTVKADVDLDGHLVQRYIYADPIDRRIATDWMRTTAEGLYKADERLATSIEQYIHEQKRQSRSVTASESTDLGQDPVQSTAPTAQRQAESAEQLLPQAEQVAKQQENLNVSGRVEDVSLAKETAKLAQSSIFQEDGSNSKASNVENESRLQGQMYMLGMHPGVASEAMEILAAGENKPIIHFDEPFGEDKAEVKARFEYDPDLMWLKLKGFDMTVTFADQRPSVTQRYFFNPDLEAANYGLQEAYNMAAGRAVSVKKVDNGDNKMVDSWSSLDLSGPLTPEGNHRVMSIPYDFSQAIKEYPKRSQLEKSLPAGVTLDDLVHQVKAGNDFRFSLKGTDVTQMYTLKVDPVAQKFSIPLISGAQEQANAVQGKNKDVSQGQKAGEGQSELTGIKRTK